MIRILDLFSGLGGVARGIQRYLDEQGLEYEYIAIDIDPIVLEIHKKLNPKSIIMQRDAYTLSKEELKEYDFIWASPPCQSHSRLNVFWRRFNPDHRLWGLINKLYQTYKPFIVENVHPYYKPPIKPKTKIDRHLFWSNLPITNKCNNIEKHKDFRYMNLGNLFEYHDVPREVFKNYKLNYNTIRRYLRNMVHSSISYCLIRQVCEITKCFERKLF